jgi:ankyrin repeat protein
MQRSRLTLPLALLFLVATCAAWSAPSVESSSAYQALLHSIVQNDLPGARRLLDEGLDPNARVHAAAEDAWIADSGNPADQPLLVVAARFGVPDSPFVAALLERKAAVDVRDSRQRTPHMYAAQLGWGATVDQLLAKKADVNAADSDGVTVLMHAMGNRNLGTVATLIGRGARVNAADNEGETPLLHALRQARHDPVRIYGRKDDPTAETAAYVELIRYLLHHKADPNRRSKSGQTALALAKGQRIPELVDLLRKAGARE